jgi:hypothetical protein
MAAEMQPEHRPDRLIIWVAIVIVLVFAACTTLLWRLGVFNQHIAKSNSQAIAAALALLGVLVTGALTFVGALDRRANAAAREGHRRAAKARHVNSRHGASDRRR